MLSVRLSEDAAKALKEAAEDEERPEGQLARILIREALIARGYLPKPEKKRK